MLYCDENIFFVHMYTVRIGLNQPSRQFKKKKVKREVFVFRFLKNCRRVDWRGEKYCRQYFVIEKKK